MKNTLIAILIMFSNSLFANCDNLINSMNDGASMKEAMKCLNKMQVKSKTEKDIAPKTDILPSKAVVAFNSDVCPSGWKTLVNGEGRVIVGSGRGNGLSARVLGDLGGAETHTLTVAQMPSHTHSYKDHYTAHNPAERYEGLAGAEWCGNCNPGFGKASMTTSGAGGSQPHNIMQPFIALKLCEKE